MNKLLLILSLLFSGCATTREITLEDLMRSSNWVGCVEARLKYIPEPLIEHQAQVAGVVNLCKDRSKEFDLRQVGIYERDMEVERGVHVFPPTVGPHIGPHVGPHE